jgi:branched-chain amino acid transport system substrate-binding protein
MKKLINSLVVATLLLGANAHADIVVGAPLALTGPIAEHAKGMRQAAEMAVNQVNQQGGVLGKTYRLEFVDTACDPNKATDVVRNLIENTGVIALVGSGNLAPDSLSLHSCRCRDIVCGICVCLDYSLG